MAGKEKQKILIVDDSEMNRLILSDILEEEFEILEAEDGEEGIMILHRYAGHGRVRCAGGDESESLD